LSVLNSLAANRRLAYRMVAVQAVVAMLVALAFLVAQGNKEALAAAIGGGAAALGSLVLAWRSLPSTPKSAGWTISRMVSGLVLKWVVVLGVLFVAMAKLAMPPLPLVVGLAAGVMSALFLTLNSKA
jgi:F0F1-type ATP synthase assembly protein I